MSVYPKNFHDSSDICPMGLMYSIKIRQISHRTFGPSHRKCPTCPMIFVNTAMLIWPPCMILHKNLVHQTNDSLCNACLWATISISLCKKNVSSLLTHWSYAFLALTHRFVHRFWIVHVLKTGLLAFDYVIACLLCFDTGMCYLEFSSIDVEGYKLLHIFSSFFSCFFIIIQAVC